MGGPCLTCGASQPEHHEPTDVELDWQLKQQLASPSRFYGDGGTIHSNGHLDVEVFNGKVVSVWYRCCLLPFKQTDVAADRANEMNRAQDELPILTGVEILDRQPQ